jgi:hypothetical protein
MREYKRMNHVVEVISVCKFSDSNNFKGVIGSVLSTAKDNQTWEIWVAKGKFVLAKIVLADSDVEETVEGKNIGCGLAREIVTIKGNVQSGRAQMGCAQLKSLPQMGDDPSSRIDVEQQELQLLEVALELAAQMVNERNESWSGVGAGDDGAFLVIFVVPVSIFSSSFFVCGGGGCGSWFSECRAFLIHFGFRILCRLLLLVLHADSVICAKKNFKFGVRVKG